MLGEHVKLSTDTYQSSGSTPGPWRCEVAILPTAPPKNLNWIIKCIKKKFSLEKTNIWEHKDFFRTSWTLDAVTPWEVRDNFRFLAKYPGTVLIPASESVLFCKIIRGINVSFPHDIWFWFWRQSPNLLWRNKDTIQCNKLWMICD